MSDRFDPYRAVLDFHRKFNAAVGPEPGFPDSETTSLRISLMEEELEELKRAIADGSLVGVADAVADLLYVVYGTAIAFGIDIRPIFCEVHRANMTKDGGGMRDDGKILKPEHWEPPRIAGLLAEQTNREICSGEDNGSGQDEGDTI